MVAVVLLLAVGGGAFALVKSSGKHSTAGSGGVAPTLVASTSAPPTPAVSTAPATTAPASPTVVPTPSPSVSPSVVSVAAGVGPVFPSVQEVLSRYFQGINNHDYAEYASAETAKGQADQPESSFDSGYATTTDTDMTLTSLTPTGNGDVTATVTFTSNQSASDSVDNSPCNSWTLNLYLVPHGTGYLIAPAPANYEPSYTDC